MNSAGAGEVPFENPVQSKLALAFIVKNEGRYALQMLESVLPVVSFVACVDNESTDDTALVIREFLNARGINHIIVSEQFAGFQSLRNAAIDLVPRRYEWILMLDADEIVLEGDHAKLQALIASGDHDAWTIPRFNWMDQVWGKTLAYPDHQARLFRNSTKTPIRYHGDLHETIAGYDSLGVVPYEDIGSNGFSESVHIHHMKMFQKSFQELEDREHQYQSLMDIELQAKRRADYVTALWNGQDPFAGAEPDRSREDYQGWRSEHLYLAQAIQESRPALVVEIGVWKGGSTIYMAELMRQQRIAGIVLAVDTWLGASDHWLQPQWFESLRVEDGYPTLFRTFRANVIGRDLQNYVLPLPLDSINAANCLAARGIRPTVIHIDAGHDYDSVIADLTAWWPLVADGGVLIGDDYEPEGPGWPDLRRAFHDFFKTDQIENVSGKCRIGKKP